MFNPIKNQKIRAVIIGCGRISKNHFDSVKVHQDLIEIIAVCDVDKLRLQEHVAIHQIKGYSTLQSLLDSETPDLAILCTPSGLHSSQTIMCAKYGVSVVTEKPMATRWHDALNMVKACDEAGVYLFVVKQNRLNPTLQMLKRALIERRFGKINIVNINVFWTRPQSYYDQASWRGTWEFDGGAFMNQASHYVDLLEWLVGPVEKVQAMMNTTRDIEVEDTGVLNIKWRNGALGSMSVTMLTYPQNLEGSITILGDKGSARVGGMAANDVQMWNFENSMDYDGQASSLRYEINSIYGFGHPLYYKNVIDTLRGLASPDTDGREGLKSLEILIAAYLSVRDNKTVTLPLEY
jgi:UDP-N-acetyl-2-amino-2-deoxyglucuronate dehydrogenase